MTEADWVACTDSTPMLVFLRGKASDRKMRLLTCACVRRIWHLLTDERSRNSVEVAEQFADDKATRYDLRAVLRLAEEAYHCLPLGQQQTAALAATYTARYATMESAPGTVSSATAYEGDRCVIIKRRPELAHQAGIIRCIFGNPFRPPHIEPAWLAWNNGTLVTLAQVIYDHRRFADLPILADALEEAGCTDANIITHCRHPMEHVRGCWALDLLLGKQ